MTQTPPDKILLRNGKLRSLPGMGKTPFGMTQKQIADAEQHFLSSQLPKNRLSRDLRSLFNSVSGLISHGNDLCREGQKDRARKWSNLLRQSAVIDLFKNPITQKITGLDSGKVSELSQSYKDFCSACHPQDAQSWETDISFIRYALETLLESASKKQRKSYAKKKENFIPRWSAEDSQAMHLGARSASGGAFDAGSCSYNFEASRRS